MKNYKLTLATSEGEVLEQYTIGDHTAYNKQNGDVYDLRGTLAGQVLVDSIRNEIKKREAK